VPIRRVVCCGGIAEKNSLLMQIYADATGRTMQVSGSSQACALGSAVAAAVLAGKAKGGYDSFLEAQEKMTSLKEISYQPNPENQKVYDRLYRLYHELHDAFGGRQAQADLGHVMKDLIRLKEEQVRKA